MKFKSAQTLQEIATLIGATFIGKSDFEITGINEIHVAKPTHVEVVGGARHGLIRSHGAGTGADTMSAGSVRLIPYIAALSK